MNEVEVGTRLSVVTPHGEVVDRVVEIIEPPTALGVTIVRCAQCDLTVVWKGVGYQREMTPNSGAKWRTAKHRNEEG